MMSEHMPPSTYILRNLIDVEVPESVSWFPQTIGWKIIAVLLVALLIYAAYLGVKHWWHNRYRTEAIEQLKLINLESASSEQALFNVTKSVMVYLNPQHASLYGEALLNCLDSYLLSKGQGLPNQTDSFRFTTEVGRKWMQSLVQPDCSLSLEERQLLARDLSYWVKTHQAACSTDVLESKEALEQGSTASQRKGGQL
ncbi:DUF4381 domain-containing protein [Vibrio paucivorans]